MSTSCGCEGIGSFHLKCSLWHVQVKLCYPLTIRAIPERLRDASCGGAIQIYSTFTFTPHSTNTVCWLSEWNVHFTCRWVLTGARWCPSCRRNHDDRSLWRTTARDTESTGQTSDSEQSAAIHCLLTTLAASPPSTSTQTVCLSVCLSVSLSLSLSLSLSVSLSLFLSLSAGWH